MLQAPPEDDSSRNMSAPNTPVMKKETLSANRSETARRRRATSNVGLAESLSSAPIDHRQTSSLSPSSSSNISSLSATPGLVTWASTMDPSELAVISPEERKRQEAIFELVSTEKSYLRDLQLIANVSKWWTGWLLYWSCCIYMLGFLHWIHEIPCTWRAGCGVLQHWRFAID